MKVKIDIKDLRYKKGYKTICTYCDNLEQAKQFYLEHKKAIGNIIFVCENPLVFESLNSYTIIKI